MVLASSAIGTGERPGVWNRLSIGQKRLIWVWTFLALPVVFYVVIRFYPTFQAFWLSFTDWDLLRPAQFIGVENYVKLYNDPVFWQVFLSRPLVPPPDLGPRPVVPPPYPLGRRNRRHDFPKGSDGSN